MLLTAVFPLLDVRAFQPRDVDSRVISSIFLREFGAVVPDEGSPERPGRRAWGAASAIRPVPTRLGGAPIRWISRHLIADGEAVARVAVTMGSRIGDRRLADAPLAAIVDDWVHLEVSIPSVRSGRVELQHAGTLLARAYARATTMRDRAHERERPFVSAGDPCFIVEFAASDPVNTNDLPGFAEAQTGLWVARKELSAAGPRACVHFIHYQDGRLRHVARRRREGLGDYHVDRECLWATLQAVVHERIGVVGQPLGRPVLGELSVDSATRLASDALQRFLNDRTPRVSRGARQLELDGDSFATLSGSAETRWEGGGLARLVEQALAAINVRPNVRRKVVSWTRQETGEEQGQQSPLPVTPAFAPSDGPSDPVPLARGIAVRVRASLGLEQIPSALRRGVVVTFVVRLRIVDSSLCLEGEGVTLEIPLPARVGSQTLTAVVTSTHFTAPHGEQWMATFDVAPGSVRPETWTFRARADSERAEYSLSVCFFLNASPAGTVSATLPRGGRGGVETISVAHLDGGSGDASRFTVRITNEAGTTRVAWFSPSGGGWQPPCDLGYDVDTRIADISLPQYQSLDALRDFCINFRLALPDAFVDAIDNDPHAQAELYVISPATLIPLEFLPLARGRPLLGMERPVMHWILDARSPTAGHFLVENVGCIRPTYTKKPLPSAIEEEAALRRRFANITLAADRAGLDVLVLREDLDVVHFAGHAQHDPAKLWLGDSDHVPPQYFWDRPVVKKKNPFFFVNGCEAGLGRPGVPPTLGNMVATLLRCRFSGVVAPLIVVDSQAARDASAAFYSTLAAGQSVGEAVRSIHALAAIQPAKAGTFLSYVGYGAPDLSLKMS